VRWLSLPVLATAVHGGAKGNQKKNTEEAGKTALHVRYLSRNCPRAEGPIVECLNLNSRRDQGQDPTIVLSPSRKKLH
jgi:hypothetical protein